MQMHSSWKRVNSGATGGTDQRWQMILSTSYKLKLFYFLSFKISNFIIINTISSPCKIKLHDSYLSSLQYQFSDFTPE